MRDTWACAWRELLRKRRRTAATVSGYALAVLALVLTVSLLSAARDSANAILRHTGTHFVVFSASCPEPCYLHDIPEKGEAFVGSGGVLTSLLSLDYLEQVRAIPFVNHAAPYILFRFKDPASGLLFTVGGFDPADAAAVGTTCCAATDVLSGRFLRSNDSGWVMIEEAYAKNRGLKMGEEIAIAGVPFRIVAIVNPGIRPGKADIYMLLPEAAAAIRRQIPSLSGFNLILVEVRSAIEQDQAIAAVRSILPNGVVSSYACYKPAASVLGMNTTSARVLSLLLGGLALLLLMRAQWSSVIERRYDIGVLKAIGWSNRHVAGQILCESTLQAAAGGILGCLVAVLFLATLPMTRLGTVATIAGSPVAVSPLLMGAGILTAIAGGIVAGFLPALHAARQRPAQALRQL